jgi:hypothetical protein
MSFHLSTNVADYASLWVVLAAVIAMFVYRRALKG